MIETQSLSSLDAEQYVLGACLVSAQSFEAAFTAIPCGGYFSLRDHQIIFDAMIRLAGVGQVIGRNTIAQLLRQDKVWAAIGGENKLLELAIQGADSHGFTIESACSEIVGYHKRREAISAANSIIEIANDSSIDHSEISPRAQDAVSRLEITSTGGPVSIADCSAAIYQRMVTETEPGILAGLYDLDAMTNGAEAGNLIIVGARPGMGKTILGLSWAGFAANILRKQVLYFSLEMSRDELAIRYASALSGVNSRRIRSHQIASDETVEQVVSTFPSMPRSLYIDECDGGSTLDYMTAAIRSQHRLGLCDMVVIDHLHLMDFCNRRGETDAAAVGRITKTLKQLARKLKISVILLCQLNRSLESRANKRPINSDLKESGSVEQDADKIIMLYRDEVYNPDTPDKAIVELIITKNRNGPTGTARALAELEFCRFRNR
jgi:replicative DNA helicase